MSADKNEISFTQKTKNRFKLAVLLVAGVVTATTIIKLKADNEILRETINIQKDAYDTLDNIITNHMTN